MLLNHYKKKNINYFRLSEYQNKKPILKNGSVVKKGKDITIVVLGHSLDLVWSASNKLEHDFTYAEIIYFNQINNVNMKNVVKSVVKTKILFCIEEISNKGGLLEDCLKELSEINFKFDHLAINDFIHKYGSYKELASSAGFSENNIIRKVKKLLKK